MQAELATMKVEVKNLREAATKQKADPVMPSHAGNGARTGGRGKVTDAHIATSVVACTILHATVSQGPEIIQETHPGYPRGTGSSLARKREVPPV